MVRQWQQIFYGKRYTGTPIVSPNFVKLAEAYDIPAVQVTKPDQVAAAYEQAHSTPGPFLIDFQVEPFANVFPMVAPGKSNVDMIRRPLPAMSEETSEE